MFPDDARLRVKPIYPIYRLDAQTFRVGAQRGLTREFRDPYGQLWCLVRAADGSRDVRAIITTVHEKYPRLTPDEIRRGLASLANEGILEDARLSALPCQELARFAGTMNHFRHYAGATDDPWSPLRKLQESSVLLLGLGGGGSTILPMLVALGFGSITAVDYDRVDAGNLNRQFLYQESDIGKLKTEVAARVVRALNSRTRFSAIDRRIEFADDVIDLIGGVDLVICALDEPPFLSQRRVNAACVTAGVPCLFGGSQVTRGRMFSVVPGASGCFDCLHLHYTRADPRFIEQFRGFHEIAFDPPTIAFPPDILRLGSAIAGEAARLATGYLPATSIGKQVELDFAGGGIEVVTQWPRYAEECPTCGDGDEADWASLSPELGLIWRTSSSGAQLK